MGWICGKHPPTVIADGEACVPCGKGTVGKGHTPAEIADQKAAYEAKGGVWGLSPTGGEK